MNVIKNIALYTIYILISSGCANNNNDNDNFFNDEFYRCPIDKYGWTELIRKDCGTCSCDS